MALTEEQKRLRRSGVGGSEIGAVVGVSPYADAATVWARKVTGHEQDETEAMRWGNRLEPVVVDAWREQAGVDETEVHSVGTLVHRTEPIAMATPDRIVVPRGGQPLLLEIKTAGARQADRWGPEGSDQVPEEYFVQATWTIMVARSALEMNLQSGEIAVLLGGQELRRYVIPYSQPLADALLRRAKEFWRHVEEGTPPVPQAASADAALRMAFPEARRPMLQVRGEGAATDALRAFREAHRAHAEAEKRLKVARAEIQALLGDAEGIKHDELGRVTWTNNRGSSKTDWQALVQHLKPSDDLLRRFTKVVPGARVLRARWNNEGEDSDG